MPHALIHHQVEDFSTWKEGYDDHKPARDAAGLTEVHLLQGINDPNEVMILFAAEDLGRLREFLASEDLKSKMVEVGVVGIPTIVELQ